MRNKLRKGLALLMAILMFISCAPMDALAAIIPVSGGTQTSSGISLQSIVKLPVATATYIFKNGDAEFARQILKDGETLNNPGTPEADSANKEFVGWFDESGNQLTFPYTASVTDTTTVIYTARFEDVYFVFFTNDKGEVMVTKKGYKGDTITTADVTYPVGNEETITGWQDESGNAVSSVILANKDITLEAIVTAGHWITYDSQQGSYVEPAFVKGDSTTTAPANPTRPGYTFDHWSETVNGTAFTFGTKLDKVLTLYAVWTPNTRTQYTVIHWQENADDDDYSYAESETKTGATGATTSATAKSYTGFTAQTITQETIAGDGSTIVNVYYKRNEYSVRFYERKNREWQEITSLTITAKYGASIGDKWPTYNGSSTWGTKTSGSQPAGPYQVNIETMPLNGAKFYGPKTGYGSESASYYVEVLPGESGETTVGSVAYKLHHKDTSPGTGYTVTMEDQYPITGFTFNSSPSTSIRGSYNNAKFYYTRNSYNIVYVSNGQTVNTVSKLFEASIADAGAYVPTRPSTLPDSYTFAGWYADPAGQQAYSFDGKTMPAQSITVYAKWEAPTSRATAFTTIVGGTSETIDPIPYGGTITDQLNALQATIMADHPSYTWRGWRTGANGTGEPFNVDTKIYSDITLYPYYTKDGTFSVTYVSHKDGVTAPTDSKAYAEDSYADLMTPDKLVSDDGQYFLGWTDGTNTYQPRDKYQIKDDVTFIGVWGARPGKVSLTYKANGGTGNDVTEIYDNNETVETIGNPFTRVGYTFAGWDTDDTAATGSIKENERVQVDDGDGENVLYAIWKANTDTKYTVEFYYQNTDGTYTLNHSDEREGTTDNTATVTEDDKANKENGKYVFEADNQNNVLSGTIAGAGTLVLKLYFKLNTAEYTIHHYLKNTTVNVADDQTGAMTIGEALTAAKSTALYAEYAKAEVDSYAPSQSVTIDADASKNVITVYYTVPLTLKAENAEKTYNGQPLTQPDFTAAGLVNGDKKESITLSMTAASTITNVGSTDNVIDQTTVKGIPSYYTVSYEEGKLTITKRSVTLTSGSAERVYNGQPLTNSTVTVSGDGFVEGEGASYDVTGTITNVGKADNKFTYKLNEGTNSNNYEITTETGLLEVIPVTDKVTVTITGRTDTVTYDGVGHTVTGYNVSIDNTLYTEKDFNFNGDGKVSATNAEDAPYPMGLKESDFENTSKNFTNVTFVVNDGSLTIKKRPVTITVIENEVTYDGQMHGAKKDTKGNIVEGTSYIVDGLVKNEEKNIIHSVTNVNIENEDYLAGTHTGLLYVTVSEDTSKNVAIVDQETNEIVTSNYNINYVAADLIIKKRSVTITVANAEKEYGDADPAFADAEMRGYVQGELGDIKLTVTRTNMNEDVDTYEQVLQIAESAEELNEKYTNYTFTVGKGNFTIKDRGTKYEITVKANSGSKVYDGKELKVEGFETLKFTVNGNTYTVSGLTAEKTGTNVDDSGEVVITGTAVVKDKDDNDVTKQFTVHQENGQLTISKRPITLTGDGWNEKQPYTGTAYTTEKFDTEKANGNRGLVEGHTVDTKYLLSGKDVDSYTGKFTKVAIKAGDVDVTSNYAITPVPGSLEIVKSKIGDYVKLTPNDVVKTYDGNTYTAGTATATENNNAGNNLKIEYSLDGQEWTTDPSTITAKNVADSVTIKVRVSSEKNYSGYLEVEQKLTINPRKVTLKSATDSKVYDGKPLTRPTVAVTGDGFVTGEVTDVKATGSVTYVTDGPNKDGEVWNTIEYTPAEGKFNSDNYTITKSEGKLKVTPVTDKVTVTITGHKDTVTYDGAEHSVAGYDVDIKCEGTALDQNGKNLYTESDFTFNGESEVKGTDAKTYKMGLAKEKFTNTNANFTNVVFSVTDGLLTINKRPVKITANDNSVIYDGQAHGKNPDAPYIVEQAAADNNRGLVNATVGTKMQTHAVDSNSVEITFTNVNAGTYTGKLEIKKEEPSNIRIMNGANDVTANYEIELAAGTLTISQRPVNVKARKLSYPYDGAAHPAENVMRYEVEGELVDGDVLDAAVLYDNQDQQMLIGDYAAVVTEVTIKNKQEEITGSYKQGTVTGNYAIAVVHNTLQITGDEPLKPTKKTESVKTNYTVGDKITYTITVKNVSKNEAKGVVVTDSMAEIQPGANYTVSEDKHTAMLEPIPAGGTVIVEAVHFVTAEDVEKAVKETKGTLTNVANIKFGDWSKDVIGNPDKLNDTYEYIVHYYWNNTDNTEIHDSMTYTAQVGTDVTELAEKIWDAERKSFEEGVTGYTPVNTTEKPSTVTLTISADKSKNVINFYYYKNVELTANSDTFVYDGTEKSVSGFTVKDANEAVVSDAEFASRITAGAAGIKADTYPAVFIKADKSDGIEAVVGTVDNTGKYIVVDTTDGKLVINPITDKTITITANSKTKGYDGTPLTDDDYTYTQGVLVNGDVLTAVVKGSQTNAGTSDNVVTDYKVTRNINGKDEDVTSSYTFEASKKGVLKVTERKITVKAEDTRGYTGEDQTLAITKDNAKNVVEGEELTLTGASITGKNVGKYTKLDNKYEWSVKKSVDGSDTTANYEIEVAGELTITGDKIKPEKTISEEVTSNYKLGDGIPFTITVKNVSTETVENIIVRDANAVLETGDGYELKTDDQGAYAWIESLASGAEVKVNATHTVTSDDILAGMVGNTATVSWPDGNETVTSDAETDTKKIDPPKVDLVVTKTSDKQGQQVKLGDTIAYTITVKNTGNVPYTNVVVNDELTGLKDIKINKLAVGETFTFSVDSVPVGYTKEAWEALLTHTVTEADIRNGKITNEVTATVPEIEYTKYDDQGNESKEKTKSVTGTASVTDNTVDASKKLTIVKQSSTHGDEEKRYALGEMIEYTITVTNDGNQTITNIRVADSLADAAIISGDGYKVVNNIAVIESLEPGKSVAIKATYEVTEQDILAGKVINNVTVTANEDPKTPTTPAEDPTDTPTAELNIEKSVLNAHADGTPFKLGEKIEYQLTITTPETNNVTVKYVKVTDTLLTKANEGKFEITSLPEGATAAYDNYGKQIITLPNIAPGKHELVIKYTYTVQETDLGTVKDGKATLGTVHNAATVAGTTDDPKVIPGSEHENDVSTVAKLTITANDNNHVYDGESHGARLNDNGQIEQNVSYTLDAELLDGHEIDSVEITFTAILVNVYNSKLMPENAKIITADDKDVTSKYYKITYVPGTLTITKRGSGDAGVIIQAKDNTVKYDGQLHGAVLNAAGQIEENTSFTVTNLAAGHKVASVEIDADGGRKYVGTYTSLLVPKNAKIVDQNNKDVTDNYDITYLPGTLTIEKRDAMVTITGPSAEREYTGQEQQITTDAIVYGKNTENGEMNVTGMLEEDNIQVGSVKHVVKGTYVGRYEGTFTFEGAHANDTVPTPTVLNNGYDVTENYNFIYVPGYLTITSDHPTQPDKEITGHTAGTKYALGDHIAFTITVRNITNAELKNVEVSDPTAVIVAGTGYKVIDEHNALIETMAASTGATPTTVVINAYHVVTEDDIRKAVTEDSFKYENVATIKVDNKTIDAKTGTNDIEDPDLTLKLEKKLVNSPAAGDAFKLGETAEFEITVTNVGNVTQTQIPVSEALEGAVFDPGEGYTLNADKTVATIAKLAPAPSRTQGESIVLKAKYTITEADLGNKELKNIATAPNAEPGEVPIPVDEAKSVSGQKVWKDEGNAFNTRPASITLTLMRKLGQDGAAEQYRTMQLGSNGSWRYSFDHLPKHDAQENEYFYWVVEEPVTGYDTAYETKDESRCDIVNTLQSYQLTIRYWIHTLGETKMDVAFPDYTATLYYNQTYDVVSPEREGTALDDISQARITGTMPLHDVVIDVYYHRIAYRLTIHYIYQDGTTAHEDYTWTYWFNDDYEVPSPIIPGFTPSIAVVAGKMPSRGLEITVVYVGNGEIVIPDEDTTLGFKTYLNAGECFE